MVSGIYRVNGDTVIFLSSEKDDFIVCLGANDPDKGYNLRPMFGKKLLI